MDIAYVRVPLLTIILELGARNDCAVHTLHAVLPRCRAAHLLLSLLYPAHVILRSASSIVLSIPSILSKLIWFAICVHCACRWCLSVTAVLRNDHLAVYSIPRWICHWTFVASRLSSGDLSQPERHYEIKQAMRENRSLSLDTIQSRMVSFNRFRSSGFVSSFAWNSWIAWKKLSRHFCRLTAWHFNVWSRVSRLSVHPGHIRLPPSNLFCRSNVGKHSCTNLVIWIRFLIIVFKAFPWAFQLMVVMIASE